MAHRAAAFGAGVAAAALVCASLTMSPAAAQPASGAAGGGAGAAAPAPSSAPAALPTALRICADPDNLPFSSQQGPLKGLYVELAELLGSKLGLPVSYTWWYTYNQRRAMRNSILVGDCDAMVALPANAEYRHRGVQKSRPFLEVGYALVSAPGAAVPTLQWLKSRRIAVRFASTPQVLFATLGGYTTVTYKTTEEVFAALAKGEADVGVLWGPVAGFENKTVHQGRWQVTPLAGHELTGQVVVGVRADQAALKTRIDQALGELQPQIQELAAKYGFPVGKPVNLELPRVGGAMPGPVLVAQTRAQAARTEAALMPAVMREPTLAPDPQRSVPVPARLWRAVSESKPVAASAPARKPAAAASAAKPAARQAIKPATVTAAPKAPAAAAPVLDPLAQAGRVRFNDQCSHCHGSDGATPIRERDVRRLSMRYDADKWLQVAQTTIRNGRTDQGMPPWKDSLNDQQIKELLAFLGTIQK